MNPSAGLTDVRIADFQTKAAPTQPEATPPNMESRVTNPVATNEGKQAEQAANQSGSQEHQKEQLDKMVQEINREYASRNISLKFSIDTDTGSLVIKVMDTTSDKVIRQIPPDVVLSIRQRMRSLLGDIFDAEA
ncbi:MAG: flagellar protein FlaG [Candidatus Zixiibacteriota bacterium]